MLPGEARRGREGALRPSGRRCVRVAGGAAALGRAGAEPDPGPGLGTRCGRRRRGIAGPAEGCGAPPFSPRDGVPGRGASAGPGGAVQPRVRPAGAAELGIALAECKYWRFRLVLCGCSQEAKWSQVSLIRSQPFGIPPFPAISGFWGSSVLWDPLQR